MECMGILRETAEVGEASLKKNISSSSFYKFVCSRQQWGVVGGGALTLFPIICSPSIVCPTPNFFFLVHFQPLFTFKSAVEGLLLSL